MEFIFGFLAGLALSAGVSWLRAQYAKIDWDKTDDKP